MAVISPEFKAVCFVAEIPWIGTTATQYLILSKQKDDRYYAVFNDIIFTGQKIFTQLSSAPQINGTNVTIIVKQGSCTFVKATKALYDSKIKGLRADFPDCADDNAVQDAIKKVKLP